MRIDLTDNNIGQPEEAIYQRNDVAGLFPIADKTIAEICKENENILIFPNSIEESDDRIGEERVISILNTSDPEKVCLVTNNVMGFIGVDNIQLKIKSRFDNGRNDFLLHYMLQRVMAFNLFDLNHNDELENVFDFAIFMFPYFLKMAMRQGIYREYQSFQHNDTHLKGALNIARHLTKNTPFIGRFAYSTREYSYDNSMTELIRHTIEFIKTKKYGKAILSIDRETKENVEAIIQHTSLYDKNERKIIMSKNLRMRTHPYYTAYQPLKILCLQILRMEDVKYGDSDDSICGILFDGAWLWEEYVNTVLDGQGFVHAKNKHKEECIYLFENRSGVRYPDFYKKGDFVLDAKYKRLGDCKKVDLVDRNDVHQVITYMTALGATRGGFVAPLECPQMSVPTARLVDSRSTLSIFGIQICNTEAANTYSDFCERMKEFEAVFLESINNKSLA